MPAGQEASLFWYFQVSGTSESNSPQHVSCSHIGGTKRSGPIRVGRLRPASLVGSLGKRSLNILRSLPAPMIQLAALIQVHSGGFVRRSFLSSAGGRRPRSWLRSNSLARCKLRRHNQSFQPTCIPWLRHSMQSAELKRYACGPRGLTFWYFQVSGTLESDSPQHVSCSHIGSNQRSGPIRVGRLRPASLVGSLGKRSLNILRSLPAPMIQLAAPIQVYSGGFAQRGFLIIASGRQPRSWLRSNSLARCKLRRHNQSFQPTCIPWLRHYMQSAELKRWA